MPQFGGAAEKCAVCNKTVYLTEKIVVEDKEDKKTFHKGCLQCSHCKCNLTLGNYASMQGVFYCKPHFKQLFATKGNYDEGFGKDKHTKNWTPQAVAAPASFVPVDKEEGSPVSKDRKETPTGIASRFGKTTLNTEKCHVCDKTVYATEKTVIEEKEGKKVFHKTCLKCSHCGVIVTLGNYASMQGVVYCKPHFKQLFAAKGNYDEGFGKEKASSKWEPQANSSPNTFVPVDKDEGSSSSKDKKETPSNIAGRFKGTAANTEKCNSCGKTVYATERIVVEDKEDKQTYHKTCLKCSHCNVVLTLGNYASMQGVMYCKPHFKQLFAAKGNYDEGFGKEKHTKKWSEKDGEESSPSIRGEKEDAQELEREIEREKEQQVEREREKQRGDKEKTEREDREKEEHEQRRAEDKEKEAHAERDREDKEEREREEQEAEERKHMEAQLEKEHEHDHDEHDHEHHDHEHKHDHEHEAEQEKEEEKEEKEDDE